ncbi:glycoside hydrolase family 18 protein [Niameybacter massiliensis]|uniref:chitinase n=1 Tax=Holtiella tumoricola TaxID=3018743 RepID=A0AA42DQJ7_9FIRM|nr:glycoside hydrolase family 18 protein [Holtiella tumoricola]MDA3733432.1 glycoside hydrolase family 18 protein [Holtiella tumoricola]
MTHKLIGYVGTRDLANVTEADAKNLDIINIAFGHVIDGDVVWKNETAKEDLARIKAINPEIKFVLSVGGWGAGGFSEAAYTEEGRKRFSKTGIDIVLEYGLDGLDLDWEYPSYTVAGIGGCIEDKQNFTLLLKQIREDLNEVNKNYLLTIAAGGGAYYLKGVEMDKAAEYLDYVQLMTYDLRGGFQTLTGHHTNLYAPHLDLFAASTEEAVRDFMAAGVPAEKLVIGIAFYSRMWKGVPNVDNGYLQMAETVGTYGPSYHELVADYINKNGFTRHWDDVCKAPYLFNGDTFISYDDEESISHKIKFMNEKGLLGAMYWEYGTDETRTLTGHMRQEIEKL